MLKDGSAIYTPGLSERRSSTSKFYHGDALGSTRGITNSSQTVTDAIQFDAFGNTISRTGTTPTPFGFVGKGQYQTDNDSGLMLLGHRYYDASVGRFISSDPAQAGDNWYAYCDNNPLACTDATGLQKIKYEGETYYRHVGDADRIKGWPHWDGPGKKWIGNDGRVRDPRGNKPPKDVDKGTRNQIDKAIDKEFQKGNGPRVIPPATPKNDPIWGNITINSNGSANFPPIPGGMPFIPVLLPGPVMAPVPIKIDLPTFKFPEFSFPELPIPIPIP